MAVLNESLATRAADLYSTGLTFDKVGEKLSVSKGRVGDLIREGIQEAKNQDDGSEGNPVVQVETEQVNEAVDEEPGLPIFDAPRDYEYNGILEQTFLMKATPILRKVALNPRIFFYFDYATKRFDFEGDIGDFLVECVEYFWKSKGYSIRVTYEEDIGYD